VEPQNDTIKISLKQENPPLNTVIGVQTVWGDITKSELKEVKSQLQWFSKGVWVGDYSEVEFWWYT